ncbi:MAG TPA: hypothetical protein VMR02_01990 [Terracidiphilus sp.]|jgi:elongation factor G|nr:hypothetical protein [Terracidiphilus sp.]
MSGGTVHSILSIGIGEPSEPRSEELKSAVDALVKQNPAYRINVENREGKIVISGEDELHLEAICKRLQESRKIAIGELRIAYRETIRKAGESEGKYIRQTGGSGNYGHCKLLIEPNDPGKGYEFINDIKGGIVPKESYERGCQEKNSPLLPFKGEAV